MESVPKYIKALRKKIGNQLIVSPTVGVIITDKEERILLLESTDPNSSDTDLGHWTIPGGFIEPEEQPADAAVRETFEETGLVVEIKRLIGVYFGGDTSNPYFVLGHGPWPIDIFVYSSGPSTLLRSRDAF